MTKRVGFSRFYREVLSHGLLVKMSHDGGRQMKRGYAERDGWRLAEHGF